MFFGHSVKTACRILFFAGCIVLLIPSIACGNWLYNAVSFTVYTSNGFPNVGYQEHQIWVGILAGAVSFTAFVVAWHEAVFLLHKIICALYSNRALTDDKDNDDSI